MYNSVVRRLLPFVTASEMEQVWEKFEAEKCWLVLDKIRKDFILMWKALGYREASGMIQFGNSILQAPVTFSPRMVHHIVSIVMLGHVSLGNLEEARKVWTDHENELRVEDKNSLQTRILLSFLSQEVPVGSQN